MTILIIQTAFIGDVILATPVIEKLHQQHPAAKIDFLLRKGNESLFTGHPFLNKIIIWDKKSKKLKNLVGIIKEVRSMKYDLLINIHRFASSGLITFLSGAKVKIGFDKNPFSFCYTKRVKHILEEGKNEVQRNMELVANYRLQVYKSPLLNSLPLMSGLSSSDYLPHLYPQEEDYESVKKYKKQPYFCIAPASVWFTKQFPAHKWAEFLNLQFITNNSTLKIYLIGSAADTIVCAQIIKLSNTQINIVNLAGQLTFLQSAALMEDALMNYCNDSAPLHIASSVNAPVTAIFCSTIPAFGFGPLSDISFIVETKEKLPCKPCGLHGFKQCPQQHFKCAKTIAPEQLIATLQWG